MKGTEPGACRGVKGHWSSGFQSLGGHYVRILPWELCQGEMEAKGTGIQVFKKV